MKTTNSIIVLTAALSVGLAASLSAMPRSKQIGALGSMKFESMSHSGSWVKSTTVEQRHQPVGPKSKRIGG